MLTFEQKKQKAYQHCTAIAKNHYENFPIASSLLKKQLHVPISVIYAFARTADDLADEGTANKQERLDSLDAYTHELNQIASILSHQSEQTKSNFIHLSRNPIFTALAQVIYDFNIPIKLFYDLINAFKQDVDTLRYQNFDEILDYCRLSANPVGRILLHLNKSATSKNLIYSDAICTGLQLINFYQDIAQDMDENNRLYLPLDEMTNYHVSINDIKNHHNNEQTQSLIQWQLQRTRMLYESGKPLCTNLSGRFAIEIRMIYTGGRLILDKLEQNTTSIYLRPRLNKKDKLKILWHGLNPFSTMSSKTHLKGI